MGETCLQRPVNPREISSSAMKAEVSEISSVANRGRMRYDRNNNSVLRDSGILNKEGT